VLALALGAVALLAMSGVATAKDRHGDDHGHDHGRHHHHHQFPLRETGTISSFDATTGKLTIALTGGETVSGLVTTETRIECEGVDDNRFDRRDHGSGDNGGNGPGGGPGPSNGSSGGPGSGSTPGGPGPNTSNGSGPGQGTPPVEGEGAPNPGEGTCTVASLVPGTVVGDAELRLEGGMAVFEEIELGHDS
jgi:hypothetical protein